MDSILNISDQKQIEIFIDFHDKTYESYINKCISEKDYVNLEFMKRLHERIEEYKKNNK